MVPLRRKEIMVCNIYSSQAWVSPAASVRPQLPHRAGTVCFTQIMTEKGWKWAKLSSNTHPLPQFVSSVPGTASLWPEKIILCILNDGSVLCRGVGD